MGIAEVIDHQPTSVALDQIVKQLDEIWIEVTGEVAELPPKRETKTPLGSVKRPMARELNKPPKLKETEDATEEAMDRVMGTEALEA